MNRKETRRTSKRLGIMDFQRKLPFNKKMALIRENIIAGKQKEKQFKEENEVSVQNQLAEKESQVIANNAKYISETRNISIIKATKEAEKEYSRTHKNR